MKEQIEKDRDMESFKCIYCGSENVEAVSFDSWRDTFGNHTFEYSLQCEDCGHYEKRTTVIEGTDNE